MIGNLVTIQVYIKQFTMNLGQGRKPQVQFGFSIGKLQTTSPIFELINSKSNSVYQVDTTIKLSLQKSALILNKSQGSIKIYLHFPGQQRKLTGFAKVVIPQTKTSQLKIYSVQYCSDNKATVQAKVGIQAQEINKIQTLQSPTSQSSLSEIRDLHHLLINSKEFNFSSSSTKFPDNVKLEKRKTNKSSEKRGKSKDRALSEIHNSAKTLRPYSAESHSNKGNNDENHQKSIQIYEQANAQLRRQIDKLQAVLELERQSALQRNQKFQQQISRFQNTLKQFQLKEKQYKQIIRNQKTKALECKNRLDTVMLSMNIERISDSLQCQQKMQTSGRTQTQYIEPRSIFRKPMSSGNRTPRGSQKFQRTSRNQNSKLKFANNNSDRKSQHSQIKVVQNDNPIILNHQAQINQLQQANERLYQQLKVYKTSKHTLVEEVRCKQLNQAILEQENQELKAEIATLEKKVAELQKEATQSDNTVSHQAIQKLQQLKERNIQLERRFFQSLKAVDMFKNDALKARQQIISKDALIQKLQKQSKTPSSTRSSDQKPKRAKLDVQQSSLHLIQASIKDRQIMRQTLTEIVPTLIDQENLVNSLCKIKNDIERSFLEFLSQLQKQNKSKFLQYKMKLSRILSEGIYQIIQQYKN